MSRVHFAGWQSYAVLLNLLRISRVHAYLSYPFVLSWSMLDAMAAGALVIGSRTPPVEEVTLRSPAEMEPYLREPQSPGWKSVYGLPKIGQ
jgi:glycosyltransferase involved in cell wall biosynthesis